MMPRPMPRKLAISRKLLKKPMNFTFAGIQRMSISSTNRIARLVRNRRMSLRCKKASVGVLLEGQTADRDRHAAVANASDAFCETEFCRRLRAGEFQNGVDLERIPLGRAAFCHFASSG